MKLRMKLQGKMLLTILGAIVIVFFAISGLVIMQVDAISRGAAWESLVSNAQAAAYLIEATMNMSVGKLRTYRTIVSGLDHLSPSARDELIDITQNMVEENPDLTSVWFVYEPNAFDGLDAAYRNRKGFNEAGRMMAIFSNIDGKIVRTAAGIDEASMRSAEWYRAILQSGKETMVEPFLFNYTGKSGDDLLVTTVGLPIVRDGRVIGAVGVDLSLALIDKIVSAHYLPEGGRATLFSNDGVIISRFDKSSIGTNYRTLRTANQNEVLANMNAGKSMSFVIPAPDGRGSTAFYHQPVFIGDTEKPWSYSLSIPSTIIERQISQVTRRIALGCIAGILLLGTIITYLIRRIVRPVVDTSLILSRYGELDLRESRESGVPDVVCMADSQDEIGDMSRALLNLRESLNNMVAILNEEGDHFTATSQELSALSEELVAAIDSVNHSVDTVTGLADRSSEAASSMTFAARNTASASFNAAQMAQRAAENAARTNTLNHDAVRDVAEVVGEMKRLTGETETCNESIGKLSRAVASITEFVTSISSIADQTNLLALNAAIEAARAGDAGRGFAVVAEEVRKLAENSNGAAKKVSELVESLSAEAESARENFSGVRVGLQEIEGRAQSAMHNLQAVQGEMNLVSDAIQGIAAASEEQSAANSEMMASIEATSTAMDKIRTAVSEIKASTGETLSASEHVSEEAQSLAAGAETLKRLLGQFQISDKKSRTALGQFALAAGERKAEKHREPGPLFRRAVL